VYLFGMNEVFDQEVNKCATCLSPTLKILIDLGGFPESGSTFSRLHKQAVQQALGSLIWRRKRILAQHIYA